MELKEYRLDEHTGTVYERDEFFKRNSAGLWWKKANRKTIEKWNALTPLEVDESTDIERLKERMKWIFKPVPGDCVMISAISIINVNWSAISYTSSAHITVSC